MFIFLENTFYFAGNKRKYPLYVIYSLLPLKMMKTNQPRKVIIKIDPDDQQENVKNTRRGLKTLQPTAVDKENLAGRPHILKDSKPLSGSDTKKQMHKETQTEKYITNIEDLTGDKPSADYWKRLAEKRQESLDESLLEIEKLKGDIQTLQEENKICKEMLEESKHLVEVLQEMINDDNEEAPNEESVSPEKRDSETESN